MSVDRLQFVFEEGMLARHLSFAGTLRLGVLNRDFLALHRRTWRAAWRARVGDLVALDPDWLAEPARLLLAGVGAGKDAFMLDLLQPLAELGASARARAELRVLTEQL